jgi:hypothetical protein
MASKSSADLSTEQVALISSQTTPNSITPETLGNQMLQDIIDSSFNKVDGVIVGIEGRDLVIPALYTPTVNPSGQTLEQVLQAILDATDATAVLVSGGVQGLRGEFCAIITPDTNQTILLDEVNTPTDTYRKQISVFIPNDKDGGGFDNGNNWILEKYVAPISVTAAFVAYGFSFNLLENNLSGGHTRTVKLVITNNGTVIASSNEFAFAAGDPTNIQYYFNLLRTIISFSAGDIIQLEVYEKTNSTSAETVRINIDGGFFSNLLS